MMGASCSICDSDKVVDISIPRNENQRIDCTELQTQERIILESNLLMNFAPILPETSETAFSQTTIESICSEIENAVLQQKSTLVKENEEPPGKKADSTIQMRYSKYYSFLFK